MNKKTEIQILQQALAEVTAALEIALPFVMDANPQDFKCGYVAQREKMIREVLAKIYAIPAAGVTV